MAVTEAVSIGIAEPGIGSVQVFQQVRKGIVIGVFGSVGGFFRVEPLLIFPSIGRVVPVAVVVKRIGVNPPPGRYSGAVGISADPHLQFVIEILGPRRLGWRTGSGRGSDEFAVLVYDPAVVGKNEGAFGIIETGPLHRFLRRGSNAPGLVMRFHGLRPGLNDADFGEGIVGIKSGRGLKLVGAVDESAESGFSGQRRGG